jgi:hypothetical protein
MKLTFQTDDYSTARAIPIGKQLKRNDRIGMLGYDRVAVGRACSDMGATGADLCDVRERPAWRRRRLRNNRAACQWQAARSQA